MTIELMSSDSDDFNLTSRMYNCSPGDGDPCNPDGSDYCGPELCDCSPDSPDPSSDDDW